MTPEDAIFRNYDAMNIAGEAIRREEARQVVFRLDELFTEGKSSEATIGDDLIYLNQQLDSFILDSIFNVTGVEMSQPYEEFQQDGVPLVSRIIRIDADGGEGLDSYVPLKIYMVGLMGRNQDTVSSLNCVFGAFKTEAGQIEFFKVRPNPNLGKMVVSRTLEYPESERILAQEGSVDQNKILVTALSPEERYLVVGEFEKALRVNG